MICLHGKEKNMSIITWFTESVMTNSMMILFLVIGLGYLVGSIKVYLHNIDEGWVKPVVISDSNVDYQTYTTNGRRLSQYKITVQESQSKIRK